MKTVYLFRCYHLDDQSKTTQTNSFKVFYFVNLTGEIFHQRYIFFK